MGGGGEWNSRLNSSRIMSESDEELCRGGKDIKGEPLVWATYENR